MQISIAWHRFEWADADSAIELVAFGSLVFVFVYFSIFFFRLSFVAVLSYPFFLLPMQRCTSARMQTIHYANGVLCFAPKQTHFHCRVMREQQQTAEKKYTLLFFHTHQQSQWLCGHVGNTPPCGVRREQARIQMNMYSLDSWWYQPIGNGPGWANFLPASVAERSESMNNLKMFIGWVCSWSFIDLFCWNGASGGVLTIYCFSVYAHSHRSYMPSFRCVNFNRNFIEIFSNIKDDL